MQSGSVSEIGWKTTDIFIEASKGPAFARRGITDEVLWEHNPKSGKSRPAPSRFGPVWYRGVHQSSGV